MAPPSAARPIPAIGPPQQPIRHFTHPSGASDRRGGGERMGPATARGLATGAEAATGVGSANATRGSPGGVRWPCPLAHRSCGLAPGRPGPGPPRHQPADRNPAHRPVSQPALPAPQPAHGKRHHRDRGRGLPPPRPAIVIAGTNRGHRHRSGSPAPIGYVSTDHDRRRHQPDKFAYDQLSGVIPDDRSGSSN